MKLSDVLGTIGVLTNTLAFFTRRLDDYIDRLWREAVAKEGRHPVRGA